MVDSCGDPMAALTIHAMPARLRRPIVIAAFSGWNDAAESATTAARFLGSAFEATKFAEIDPEEFYHFGLARPTVRFKEGSETEREVIWPAIVVKLDSEALGLACFSRGTTRAMAGGLSGVVWMMVSTACWVRRSRPVLVVSSPEARSTSACWRSSNSRPLTPTPANDTMKAGAFSVGSGR